LTACMIGSSESWGPQHHPLSWHSRPQHQKRTLPAYSITSSARVSRAWRDGEVERWRRPLTAAKGTSVILVLNQYKCIECSPGKHPDTRMMATGSDDDSLDIVHDRNLCISV